VCADSDAAALEAVSPQLLVLARAGAAAVDAAALRLLVRDAQVVAAAVPAVSSHAVVLAHAGAAALDAAAALPIVMAPARPRRATLGLLPLRARRRRLCRAARPEPHRRRGRHRPRLAQQPAGLQRRRWLRRRRPLGPGVHEALAGGLPAAAQLGRVLLELPDPQVRMQQQLVLLHDERVEALDLVFEPRDFRAQVLRRPGVHRLRRLLVGRPAEVRKQLRCAHDRHALGARRHAGGPRRPRRWQARMLPGGEPQHTLPAPVGDARPLVAPVTRLHGRA